MLQIRLSTIQSLGGSSKVAKPVPADTVTVACPDHLVLADLPVAKGLGSPTTASHAKIVGRKSQHQFGERVHFCVRCDFPIAIYGRLSPCGHAFCLDCARSDSICYLCDERVQKIQTIKIKAGILVCAAPHCFKSFLKKSEFKLHIQKTHADLLQPNAAKNGRNETETFSTKHASGSNARAPPEMPFSLNSTSQANDDDDKAGHSQLKDQQPLRPMLQPILTGLPYFGKFQSQPSVLQPSHNAPSCFPPKFTPFSHSSFPLDGAQLVFGFAHEMTVQPGLASAGKSDQGGLLGFPQPWNMGAGATQGMVHGFPSMLDPQGRGVPFGVSFERRDYNIPNMTPLPLNMPPNPLTNQAMDMEGKGILAPQSLPVLPLPPMPPHHFQQPRQRE